MPPRRLISLTASCAVEVVAGPHIPGEPEQQTKPATRSRLRAPRGPNPLRSIGASARSDAADARFLNNRDGGNGRFLAVTLSVECTPAPVWHRTLDRKSTRLNS